MVLNCFDMGPAVPPPPRGGPWKHFPLGSWPREGLVVVLVVVLTVVALTVVVVVVVVVVLIFLVLVLGVVLVLGLVLVVVVVVVVVLVVLVLVLAPLLIASLFRRSCLDRSGAMSLTGASVQLLKGLVVFVTMKGLCAEKRDD